jgi:hypothetical protein
MNYKKKYADKMYNICHEQANNYKEIDKLINSFPNRSEAIISLLQTVIDIGELVEADKELPDDLLNRLVMLFQGLFPRDFAYGIRVRKGGVFWEGAIIFDFEDIPEYKELISKVRESGNFSLVGNFISKLILEFSVNPAHPTQVETRKQEEREAKKNASE